MARIWTEEMKQAKSEAMKAKILAKQQETVLIAPVEQEEEEGIVTPALVEENVSQVTPEIISLLEVKPDLSRLDEDSKMQSLINLLKVLPEQYRQDRAMLKENVYRLARFEPTDAQLDIVLDGAYVPPQRFPN
jgi:hypothetical protein